MAAFIVAVTGASGAIYARNMLLALLDLNHDILLTVTEPGLRVLREELLWDLPPLDDPDFARDVLACLNRHGPAKIKYFNYRDIGACIASGSNKTDGMIVIPCTMSTLSGIAAGASGNLVERAADVMLKERRPLVVVPRETPFNAIHLKNMLDLARIGVHIVPAAPAFYQKPQTIDDLANFVVGKVFDLLNVEHNLFKRWEG
ncbi:MAG: UbiX family flavin prenyltransferase [Eubacteriales bacterium]